MIRLPVSGAAFSFRLADGADDILLHEFAGNVVEAGIFLLSRLAGAGIADLCVTDFELLLLQLRAARFGQKVALGFTCPQCRAVAELSFEVAELAAAVKPRAVRGVAAEAGWFVLNGARFRLPSAADQAAVIGRPHATRLLAERCLDGAARQKPLRAAVEQAMAAMAPPVSRQVAASCPACGAAFAVALHVTRLVMAELRRAAAAVHDEVDLIASAYHWPEAMILRLPPARRLAYAARIRHGQAREA